MYIKDIERVQKRATKYILNDFYLMLQIKTIETKIVIPLMHWLELQDIMYLLDTSW